MKQQHDKNLSFISSQLFGLQTNLMKKEKHLSQLINEREKVGFNKLRQTLATFFLDNIGTAASHQKTAEEKCRRKQ